MYASDSVANFIYVFNSNFSVFATIPYTNSGGDTALTLNLTENIVYFSSNTALTTKILNSVISTALTFWINGSSSEYNKFLRDIVNSPAWTTRIVFYSQANENIRQVIYHTYKNPNGLIITIPLLPNLSISPYQFQGGIRKLDFPDNSLILGTTEWFSDFLVKANTQINLVLIYQQIDKSSLLINKTPLQDTMDIGFTLQPQLVDGEEMKNAKFGDFIPIDEKIYSKRKKNLILPFDLGSFNEVFNKEKLKK